MERGSFGFKREQLDQIFQEVRSGRESKRRSFLSKIMDGILGAAALGLVTYVGVTGYRSVSASDPNGGKPDFELSFSCVDGSGHPSKDIIRVNVVASRTPWEDQALTIESFSDDHTPITLPHTMYWKPDGFYVEEVDTRGNLYKIDGPMPEGRIFLSGSIPQEVQVFSGKIENINPGLNIPIIDKPYDPSICS